MDHDRKQNVNRPNKASSMEPAEGSRETVLDSDSGEDTAADSEREEGDANSSSTNEGQRGGSDRTSQAPNKGGGISNRDLDREKSEQEQVPERGRTRSED